MCLHVGQNFGESGPDECGLGLWGELLNGQDVDPVFANEPDESGGIGTADAEVYRHDPDWFAVHGGW